MDCDSHQHSSQQRSDNDNDDDNYNDDVVVIQSTQNLVWNKWFQVWASWIFSFHSPISDLIQSDCQWSLIDLIALSQAFNTYQHPTSNAHNIPRLHIHFNPVPPMSPPDKAFFLYLSAYW